MIDINDLKRQLALLDISGVCSLEIKGQTVLAEAFGYADMAKQIPNKTDTRFATASMAKGFTAVATLQLIEQNKLTLATRVTDVLPSTFPHMSAEVTIEHLLTHTSGFEDYCDEVKDVYYDDSWNKTLTEPKAYLPLIADMKMEFAPGSKFKYNNGAFVILSLVVEAVSGRGFSQFVTENVLQPAGMINSGYFRMDNLPANTAIGYTEDAGQLRPNLHTIPIIGGGDGGIYLTLADLSKFWRALSNNTLLKHATITEAWTPHVSTDEDNVHYGLGFWLVNGEAGVDRVLLLGGDRGVACRSCYYPQHDAVITVLINRDSGSYAPYKLLDKCLMANV